MGLLGFGQEGAPICVRFLFDHAEEDAGWAVRAELALLPLLESLRYNSERGGKYGCVSLEGRPDFMLQVEPFPFQEIADYYQRPPPRKQIRLK